MNFPVKMKLVMKFLLLLLFFLKKKNLINSRTTSFKDNNIDVVDILPTKHKKPNNGQNILLIHLLLYYRPSRYVKHEKSVLKKVNATLRN